MKSALDPNCRLKSIWKAASSEETQTLSLCQSRVPGDGVLLARLLSRQGVGPPPLPRPARQHHRAGPGGRVWAHARFPPPHAVDHPRDTAKARPHWNRGFLAGTVEAGTLRRGTQLNATQAELWLVILSICMLHLCSETALFARPP